MRFMGDSPDRFHLVLKLKKESKGKKVLSGGRSQSDRMRDEGLQQMDEDDWTMNSLLSHGSCAHTSPHLNSR